MNNSAKFVVRPVIVGVGGGSGSGKTTVVGQVVNRLGADRVTCIQHDSYYIDRSDLMPEERSAVNYDHPDALETPLLLDHLQSLKAGISVDIPVYDFREHVRTGETKRAEPRAVLLVEGILILVDQPLRELMDIKVFVDTDADVRLIRRMERDMATRQRSLESVMQQYERTVRPMHLEFVEPSKRYADMVIPEGGYNHKAVEMLCNMIGSIAENPEPETPNE